MGRPFAPPPRDSGHATDAPDNMGGSVDGGGVDDPQEMNTPTRVARDLRVRFGLLLGVALAPLLAFSIWQSVADYSREQERREALLSSSAEIAVDELTATIDETFTALRVLSESVEGQDCLTAFAPVVADSEAIDHLILADAEGNYVCSPTNVSSRLQAFEVARTLTPDAPDLIEVRRPSAAVADRFEPVLVLFHGDFGIDAELDRIFVAGISLSRLDGLADTDSLPEGSDIAILTRGGAPLYASSDDFPTLGVEEFPEGGTRARHFVLDSPEIGERHVTLMQTGLPNLYTALSAKPQSLLTWQWVNPLTSAMIPLLAWLFAFGAIWFAADRLVLSHLRQLRHAALRFASGDDAARVSGLDDAPEQIRQVGRTFDLMAERIAEREGRLRTGLEEKEVLLREIHHRVKNNLQIIISLLNMQQREMDAPEGREAIEDARNRVGAIALVHRSLYESDDLADVDMKPFLDSLAQDLFLSMEGRKKGIELRSDLSSAEFDADKAIPVALFVVEALSNAIKHGVPDGGRIHLAFDVDAEDGEKTLCVRDTGNGIPEGTDTSTGIRLMQGFARQLGGRLEQERVPDGFEVRAKF